MPETTFATEVRYVPNAVIIDLAGEINAQAEEALNQVFSQALSSASAVILLNFSLVDYINSTGIALIVNLLAQSRKASVRLYSFGLSEHYQEIFRITRLADYIQVYPSEAAALSVL